MRDRWVPGLAIVLLLAGGYFAWTFGTRSTAASPRPSVPAPSDPEGAGAVPWSHEPIQPIPLHQELSPSKVALGKRLFKEGRLSRDGTVSCASCHDSQKGGTDQLARSVGIEGQLSDVNTPTVLNATFNAKQFWDGRANSLEEQVEGPLLNPKEMGNTWPEILGRLRQDPSYVSAFKEIYPEGISVLTVKISLATYVRSLTTPDSPFDRFLRGNPTAISEDAMRGYEVFKLRGCVRCHQGVNVGGNIFSKFGVLGDYFKDRGQITKSDYGRFNVTQKEEDRFVFKVPGLRNVALTAPYFHDGSTATLPEAVVTMARYQLGKELPRKEVELIVAFLNSLTAGEIKD